MDITKLETYLRSSLKNKKDEIPVYIRVIKDSRHADIASGVYVPTENKWNAKKQCISGMSEEVLMRNHNIEKKLQSVREVIIELDKEGFAYTPKDVIDRIKNKNIKINKTLLSVAKAYLNFKEEGLKRNNESKQKVEGFSEKTLVKVNNFYKKLENYLKSYSTSSDVFINKLNNEFVDKFKEFMIRNGNNANTIAKEFSILKAMINWAVNYKYIDRPPIKIKVSYIQTKIKYLTESELEKVLDVADLTESEAVAKDMFLFSVYTSISHQDLRMITKSDLKANGDGTYFIEYLRNKNLFKVLMSTEVPIIKQAQELLDKYKDYPTKDNRLLPVFSNQYMNRLLKNICDKAGISKNLSFHMGRHTSATTFYLSNGMREYDLMSLMGHKSFKTTQQYAKVLKEDKTKSANNVSAEFERKQKIRERKAKLESLGITSDMSDDKKESINPCM